mmetsp:Transcript_15383/g.33338  ORF Transcript_15383/g.33338 Transcript_15383/m.33338 type:complete len:212 (+) Transcript_15383:910-1545(+)
MPLTTNTSRAKPADPPTAMITARSPPGSDFQELCAWSSAEGSWAPEATSAGVRKSSSRACVSVCGTFTTVCEPEAWGSCCWALFSGRKKPLTEGAVPCTTPGCAPAGLLDRAPSEPADAAPSALAPAAALAAALAFAMAASAAALAAATAGCSCWLLPDWAVPAPGTTVDAVVPEADVTDTLAPAAADPAPAAAAAMPAPALAEAAASCLA